MGSSTKKRPFVKRAPAGCPLWSSQPFNRGPPEVTQRGTLPGRRARRGVRVRRAIIVVVILCIMLGMYTGFGCRGYEGEGPASKVFTGFDYTCVAAMSLVSRMPSSITVMRLLVFSSLA